MWSLLWLSETVMFIFTPDVKQAPLLSRAWNFMIFYHISDLFLSILCMVSGKQINKFNSFGTIVVPSFWCPRTSMDG